MAQRFWDTLSRKGLLINNDKLLVGNDATGGVNYSNLSDLIDYIAAEFENRVEFRFSLNSNPLVPPILDKDSREPEGWSLEAPDPTAEGYVWTTMTSLVNDSLVEEWKDPIRLSGLDGINGSPGVPGADGSDFEVRYAKNGSFTVPPSVDRNARIPTGWDIENPNLVTGEYLWEIRAKINTDNTLNGQWTTPIRTSGIDGSAGNASFKSLVFIRSLTLPSTPQGGSYDSPLPTTPGWSDGTPSGNLPLYMSTRIFTTDGQPPQQSVWTQPELIADTADIDFEFSSVINFPGTPTTNPTAWSNHSDESTIWMAVRRRSNGVWSEWEVSKIKGEDGRDGRDGESGHSGMNVVRLLAYRRGATIPNKPTVDSTYNFTTSQLTPLNNGWVINIPYDDGNPLWVIGATASSFSDTDTIAASEWSDPVQYVVSGKDGPQGVPGLPGEDGAPKYTWIRYADDDQGNGISNDPTGKIFIGLAYNKDTPIESNTPSDYTWSRFRGEDGTNGVPGPPGPDGESLYTWIAYSDNADGSDMYQIPNENTKYIGIAVNKTTPIESTNPADYTWSKFKGSDGVSSFKSIVFTRSASAPATPTGGSYNSPLPTTAGWTDGVPTGTLTLYMSTRIFTNTGEAPQQSTWTTPNQASDSADIDFEFSSVETNPGNPTDNPNNWYNDATESSIWMAVRKYSNGSWGAWQISKIKGEGGDSAPLININGATQIITVSKTGANTPSAAFTVVGSAINTTINSWQYSVNGAAFSNTAPTGVTRSGNTITITPAAVTFRTLSIRMGDGQVSDTFTVSRVIDGIDGESGTDGKDGYTVILTNESHTFAGSETSALAANTITQVIVLKGITTITATSISVGTMPTGMTSSVTGNTITFTVTTSMVNASGIVPITIIADGVTFVRNFSYSISFKGASGLPGLNQATIFLYRRTENNTVPAKPTNNVTYTFATGDLSPAPNQSWTRTLPSAGGRFKWMIQATAINTTATDVINATEWSDPIIISEDGLPGTNGPALAYRGDWSSLVTYKGTTDLVDFVVVGAPGGRQGYIARTDAGDIPAGTPVSNTTYWNGPIPNADALFTDFLVAYSAYIDNLTVGSVRTNTIPSVVPDLTLGSEATTIGYRPIHAHDPTSAAGIFSRHGIRQYHPSGRISVYIGPVNNYEYTRIVDDVPEQATVDGWAIITFEDIDNSPVFFVLDNATLSGIKYAKVGADTYNPIRRVVVKTGLADLTQTDINNIIRTGTRRYEANAAAIYSNPNTGVWDRTVFANFNIYQQNTQMYNFVPGINSPLHSGIMTDTAGTYFNGWIVAASNIIDENWLPDDVTCTGKIEMVVQKIDNGVITDTKVIRNNITLTRSTTTDNWVPNPPLNGQYTGVNITSVNVAKITGEQYSADSGALTFGARQPQTQDYTSLYQALNDESDGALYSA